MSPRILLALPALLLLPLAACGSTDDDGRTTVVTSFYPLQYLVEQIAGDTVRVVNLTGPGVEPHDLEPEVQQVAEISEADLVVYSGGLQPAIDRTVEENASDHRLDVTGAVDLTDDNPHFWLDPLRMEKAAVVIEKRLAEVDPENAAVFATNLNKLGPSLRALDAEYTTRLSDCNRTLVVTSHDAFGYLSRYGLRFAPIAGLSPDAEPSPAHLAELRDLIRTEKITTVFSETIASPKMAETLADDLGLNAAVLDPLEGVREGAESDYLSLMRVNLDALVGANDCGDTSTSSPVRPDEMSP